MGGETDKVLKRLGEEQKIANEKMKLLKQQFENRMRINKEENAKAERESKKAEALKTNPSKRKKQLEEMEMFKKEIENSKITDIKLDSSIEGMIIKLDALTKSKILRKQIKDLLEEIEEFKIDDFAVSGDIPKLIKKVEAQIKKTKNKKVVEELEALKKQVEETEFKELKEAKSYKEKHPESKAVMLAECPCGDSKEELKACKKEVASLMRKLKKHTK
jgi:hypothetical protein